MDDFGISENNSTFQEDMASVSQNTDDMMCEKIFNFLNEVDNGWSVSSQDDPFVVIRNSDGKQFIFPQGGVPTVKLLTYSVALSLESDDSKDQRYV